VGKPFVASSKGVVNNFFASLGGVGGKLSAAQKGMQSDVAVPPPSVESVKEEDDIVLEAVPDSPEFKHVPLDEESSLTIDVLGGKWKQMKPAKRTSVGFSKMTEALDTSPAHALPDDITVTGSNVEETHTPWPMRNDGKQTLIMEPGHWALYHVPKDKSCPATQIKTADKKNFDASSLEWRQVPLPGKQDTYIAIDSKCGYVVQSAFVCHYITEATAVKLKKVTSMAPNHVPKSYTESEALAAGFTPQHLLRAALEVKAAQAEMLLNAAKLGNKVGSVINWIQHLADLPDSLPRRDAASRYVSWLKRACESPTAVTEVNRSITSFRMGMLLVWKQKETRLDMIKRNSKALHALWGSHAQQYKELWSKLPGNQFERRPANPNLTKIKLNVVSGALTAAKRATMVAEAAMGQTTELRSSVATRYETWSEMTEGMSWGARAELALAISLQSILDTCPSLMTGFGGTMEIASAIEDDGLQSWPIPYGPDSGIAKRVALAGINTIAQVTAAILMLTYRPLTLPFVKVKHNAEGDTVLKRAYHTFYSKKRTDIEWSWRPWVKKVGNKVKRVSYRVIYFFACLNAAVHDYDEQITRFDPWYKRHAEPKTASPDTQSEDEGGGG